MDLSRTELWRSRPPVTTRSQRASSSKAESPRNWQERGVAKDKFEVVGSRAALIIGPAPALQATRSITDAGRYEERQGISGLATRRSSAPYTGAAGVFNSKGSGTIESCSSFRGIRGYLASQPYTRLCLKSRQQTLDAARRVHRFSRGWGVWMTF